MPREHTGRRVGPAYCNGYLGSTEGDDSNRDAAGGGFESDGDKASSFLDAGITGSYGIVKFYCLADYGGGYNCLDANEFFLGNLSRNTFSDGANMNNSIRSHKWVECCDRFMH
ncbi:hypothetical protein [Streptomyces sp. NPDC050507]|uniref:hypothetical protein n=1 Tax=Streptomyces sp. NPDC050507 TaxID=3365619 RepID=UPI0037B8C5BA